jgi:preprotein translocase subunit Sec63
MIFSVSLPWRGGWGGSITTILLWLCLTLQLLAVMITTISAERIQPYDVLGIHRRATNQEIRKAYKSKVKQWHPDKNEQAKLYIPSTISTAEKSYLGI